MAIIPFLDPIEKAIQVFLINSGLTSPPWSGIFLLVVSFIISSITGLLNRLLLDMDKLAEQNEEMQKHQKRKKKAMETADKKLWISVKRDEERIMTLQRKTMMSRMLPSFITMGPFIFFFTTLRGAYQTSINFAMNLYCVEGNPDDVDYICDVGDPTSRHGAVVVMPFKLHDLPLIGKWFSPYAANPNLSVAGFSFWYFLSAIVVSTLIQRLLGVNITGMQSPGTGGLGR